MASVGSAPPSVLQSTKMARTGSILPGVSKKACAYPASLSMIHCGSGASVGEGRGGTTVGNANAGGGGKVGSISGGGARVGSNQGVGAGVGKTGIGGMAGGGKKTGTVGTGVGSTRSGVGANCVLMSATWARWVAEICGLVRVGMGVRRVGSKVCGEAASFGGWVASVDVAGVEPEQARARTEQQGQNVSEYQVSQQGTPLQSGRRDTCHSTQPEKQARGHEMPLA